MVYLKTLSTNANVSIVQLGGPVATNEMIADGWFEYNGTVPHGDSYRLANGVLEAFTPELPELEQVRIYKEYLDDTDHKLISDYEIKPGEDLKEVKKQRSIARAYVREHERKNINQ